MCVGKAQMLGAGGRSHLHPEHAGLGIKTDCLLAVDTPRFMGVTPAKRGPAYIRNILEHSPCEVLQ